jgi:rubrerythrin
MANGHGGEGSPKVSALLSGNETLGEVLRVAIQLEKNSILFYLGLEDLVPAKLGRDRVLDIIEEEKRHVAVLARELANLKD